MSADTPSCDAENKRRLLQRTSSKSQRTRERILQMSLALLNELGEQRVSTNHIAEALKISPGNLYYHFPNKAAILQLLFERYHADIMACMALPDRPVVVMDKLDYFRKLAHALSKYRFVHRSFSHLLDTYPGLLAIQRPFVQQVIQQGIVVYQQFVQAGLMQATPAELEALVINIWIVLTNWANYLDLICPPDKAQSGQLDDDHWIRQGLRQMIMLEKPYATADAHLIYEKLLNEYEQRTLST